jgi:iron complex outermembrane receptor protein
MSMFDLERVEVLRGPQSTLFGRNATGGLVQLISAKPTTTPEGYATITVGQYGLTDITAALSGPISDRVQGRLAISTIKHDGLDRNNAGPDKYDQNTQNFRGQLRVEPTEGVDFTLMLRGTRDRDASTPYVPVPGALNTGS